MVSGCTLGGVVAFADVMSRQFSYVAATVRVFWPATREGLPEAIHYSFDIPQQQPVALILKFIGVSFDIECWGAEWALAPGKQRLRGSVREKVASSKPANEGQVSRQVKYPPVQGCRSRVYVCLSYKRISIT